jgi:hypothetical protein
MSCLREEGKEEAEEVTGPKKPLDVEGFIERWLARPAEYEQMKADLEEMLEDAKIRGQMLPMRLLAKED